MTIDGSTLGVVAQIIAIGGAVGTGVYQVGRIMAGINTIAARVDALASSVGEITRAQHEHGERLARIEGRAEGQGRHA